MKASAGQAALFAYLGAALLVIGVFPGLIDSFGSMPLLHALWHLWLFVGAALLIYGLESLRTMARRYRRMTM